jgi:regulator of protease activity HflC (stomatin/prohibitin superfamily)
MVKQKTSVVIERLGKFQKVSRAGLHFKIPLIDRIAGDVNLRVRELPVEVETKTKDDVFVRVVVSVQFFCGGY